MPMKRPLCAGGNYWTWMNLPGLWQYYLDLHDRQYFANESDFWFIFIQKTRNYNSCPGIWTMRSGSSERGDSNSREKPEHSASVERLEEVLEKGV
jgi:hypothetical protein